MVELLLSREEVRCKQWQLCEETSPVTLTVASSLYREVKMRACGRMRGVKC